VDQRQDVPRAPQQVERRSVIRIAGETLKEYADKLHANARWLKEFLYPRK
jgi:hypothetical protein